MQELLSLFSAIVTSLQNMEEGLVIFDNRQPDVPIVYVNDGFLDLNGYSFDEVVGYKCRFLQCDRTDQEELDRVRHAISHGEKVTVELWNQRKDRQCVFEPPECDPGIRICCGTWKTPGGGVRFRVRRWTGTVVFCRHPDGRHNNSPSIRGCGTPGNAAAHDAHRQRHRFKCV